LAKILSICGLPEEECDFLGCDAPPIDLLTKLFAAKDFFSLRFSRRTMTS
jgi:hypothetical protein